MDPIDTVAFFFQLLLNRLFASNAVRDAGGTWTDTEAKM